MALAAGEQTHADRRSGYALRYPAGYVLEAPGTGTYITIRKDGRRVISAVVESPHESRKEKRQQSPDGWKDFILERAMVSCMADGPDGSVYCDRIARQRSWQNSSGLRVIEFYLRQVDERFGPPRTRSMSTVGPVYGVDISRPGYVLGLLVGSGHEFPVTPEDKQLVEKIVESVHLLPDAKFQPSRPILVGPGPLFEGVPGRAVVPANPPK
jgi:hypothetical protein